MGSQVIKVLRQGVWASLTGGWYYDPRHSKFTNVFHLYTWLILLCLPLIFYMVPAFAPDWAIVGTYAATVFTLFAGIKITNFRLHRMFDEGEVVRRKEVVPPDNQAVAIDEVISEDNGNAEAATQPVEEAFRVAGSSDALERREQEEKAASGDAHVPKDNKEEGREDPSGKQTTRRDLEVDVHIDPQKVVQALTRSNETSNHAENKKQQRKRKHRQQLRSEKKAVNFVEASVQTERRPQVGRCVSLPSASSDTDKLDTDDYARSTDTDSNDDSNDTTESSEDNESSEKGDAHAQQLRPRARPMRRRAVRGLQQHPWYNRPRKRDGSNNGQDTSTSSSGCSDDWQKTADNNNGTESQLNPTSSHGESSKNAVGAPRRKRTPEKGTTLSPQRKLPALDPQSTASHLDSRRNDNAEDVVESMQKSPNERDGDREHATSDQELLARDPVWRARRSQRYSSDRRLFFRRRSYTVNANRSRERDNRRRVSTVPPYSGRRVSPPRRGPLSLQKLMSMWNRDNAAQSTQNDGTVSPGQLSPGEVVLTGHSVDNTEFQGVPNSPGNVFFPPGDSNFPPSEGATGHDGAISEGHGKGHEEKETIGLKAENGSHNSNPHCNEVSTPKNGPKKDEEHKLPNKRTSTSPKQKKHRPRSSKRTAIEDPNTPGSSRPWHPSDEYPGLNGLPVRPDTPIPSSGVITPSHIRLRSDSAEEDYEEDMNKFVKDLIGAQASWQGTGEQGSSADPETGMVVDPQIWRRSSPAEGRSNRDDAEVQKLTVRLHNQPASSSRNTRRPRHSFPVSSERSATRLVVQPRPSAPIPWHPRSSSSRRVRHPAGNSDSHSRLASNTSEEGGAAVGTTTQQISANSMTSTTELLAGGEGEEIPPEVVNKLAEVEDAPGVHIAIQHDDTSAGATHSFQDEHGNWYTYTFGEPSGTAQALNSAQPSSQRSSSRNRLRLRTHSSAQSGDGESSDEAKSPPPSRRERTRRITFPSISRRFNQRSGNGMDLSIFLESDMSGSFTQADWPEMSQLDFILNNAVAPQRRATTPRVKLFYKFDILPFKSVILQYDRLALLDLLDRNRLVIENIFAMLFALIVAVLGLVLLQKGFFLDVWPLWFCAVIATAQYSLVRSVQPDSASPTHGHNRVIAYSRPVYFIILALLILLFNFLASDSVNVPMPYVYAGLYFTKESYVVATNVLLVLIMLLPFIFLLGLLPQINTFLMYFAEQLEIHMFGGSACTGLISALYSLGRSVLVCLPLFGFCYGGMNTSIGSQHILFSAFCGFLVSFSYHLSRQTNNPLHLWELIRSKFFPNETPADDSAKQEEGGDTNEEEQNPDQLSAVYVQNALSERIQSDLIVCPFIAIFMFAIHCSTAFTVLQPALTWVFYITAGLVGFLNHYVLPQLRKQLPWLLFSSPILKAKEYDLFEIQEEAKVMWFERVCVWLSFIERNIIYPLVIMNELTRDAGAVIGLYGLAWGCVILSFVGLKLLRSSYNVTLLQYAILVFSALFKKYDGRDLDDPTIITYFLVSIFFVKLQEMILKLQFIYVYIAPWQITWGSAFHAFAQPFSVPHSGMLLLHTTISSFLQAPLAPFLGSAVFLTSYIRPLKFWERNYNTKRVDHSNTRLASQIDRGPSTDDNNLNSIFYEHLTLSLQKSLCGDIAMGRWGNVYPGDCFIMASDYLNALVHIIQKGNGVITFQLRGLEFSGTYCQQREVEAISEGIEDNSHCCCFHPGHPRNMLSFNAAFSQRWLAWQVQTTKFVVDGYSITDNSATSMLGVYDLRKILLSYIVKSVIYFLISHESLERWLAEEAIQTAIRTCEAPDYVDVDTSFSVTIHDDYDMWLTGISRTKFQAVYGRWITYCSSRREKPIDTEADSKLVTLCYMVSVLSRRALGAASSNVTASHVVLESFLYGLHSLFKGDFRIQSTKDEWVFCDMDLLHNVVAPGVRMSLKLHQDHFQSCLDDDDDYVSLYDVITTNINAMVITHEADPQWRKAVLSNRSSLLALRHVSGDAVDSYFVITLRRRSQGFRIVRVNRECVKGLWAGQQQELVFLRNSNPERGSIQNAKQVLRNMINSSCDQPIGYPIYVSPVTTSFSNTHPQYEKIAGGSMSVHGIRQFFSSLWSWILRTCGGGCNSGGSAGINITAEISNRRTTPPTSTISTQVPPLPHSVRTSVTGSQSSGTVPNVPDPNEQVSVHRMIRTSHPHRSLSHESRRIGRSMDEYQCGNVFMCGNVSSTSLYGVRSSSRWRMGADSGKTSGSRHPSGTGSMEMSPITPKYPVQASSSNRMSRNSRREGTESPASSDTVVMKSFKPSLPSEEARTSQPSVLYSSNLKKLPKSASALAQASSSSSSMSRGDSLTVVGEQLAPPSKSSRKSSGDAVEDEAKASNSSGKTGKDVKQKKSKSKPDRQQSKDAEKELVKITEASRVFETLEIKRQTEFVKWPNEEWRKYGGRSKWGDWRPKKDMVGEVVHRWYPNHRNPNLRSHIGEVISLLQIEDPSSAKNIYYVPIPEKCTTPFKQTIETTQF